MLQLSPCCCETAEKWDLIQLFTDLGNVKNKYILSRNKPPFEALSPGEKDYFCLLLSGKNLMDISQYTCTPYNSVKSQMRSRVYDYVELLVDKQINHHSDVYIYLEEAGYKKSQSMELIVEFTEAIDQGKILKYLETIKNLTTLDEETKKGLIELLRKLLES